MLLLALLLALAVSWRNVLPKLLVSLHDMILDLLISSLDQAIPIRQ